jgi:hypothetical protein
MVVHPKSAKLSQKEVWRKEVGRGHPRGGKGAERTNANINCMILIVLSLL